MAATTCATSREALLLLLPLALLLPTAFAVLRQETRSSKHDISLSAAAGSRGHPSPWDRDFKLSFHHFDLTRPEFTVLEEFMEDGNDDLQSRKMSFLGLMQWEVSRPTRGETLVVRNHDNKPSFGDTSTVTHSLTMIGMADLYREIVDGTFRMHQYGDIEVLDVISGRETEIAFSGGMQLQQGTISATGKTTWHIREGRGVAGDQKKIFTSTTTVRMFDAISRWLKLQEVTFKDQSTFTCKTLVPRINAVTHMEVPFAWLWPFFEEEHQSWYNTVRFDNNHPEEWCDVIRNLITLSLEDLLHQNKHQIVTKLVQDFQEGKEGMESCQGREEQTMKSLTQCLFFIYHEALNKQDADRMHQLCDKIFHWMHNAVAPFLKDTPFHSAPLFHKSYTQDDNGTSIVPEGICSLQAQHPVKSARFGVHP